MSASCSLIKAMSLSRSRPLELLNSGWIWTEAAITGDFRRVLMLVWPMWTCRHQSLCQNTNTRSVKVHTASPTWTVLSDLALSSWAAVRIQRSAITTPPKRTPPIFSNTCQGTVPSGASRPPSILSYSKMILVGLPQTGWKVHKYASRSFRRCGSIITDCDGLFDYQVCTLETDPPGQISTSCLRHRWR